MPTWLTMCSSLPVASSKQYMVKSSAGFSPQRSAYRLRAQSSYRHNISIGHEVKQLHWWNLLLRVFPKKRSAPTAPVNLRVSGNRGEAKPPTCVLIMCTVGDLLITIMCSGFFGCSNTWTNNSDVSMVGRSYSVDRYFLCWIFLHKIKWVEPAEMLWTQQEILWPFTQRPK